MKTYSLEAIAISTNEYNETIESFVPAGEIVMAIGANNRMIYTANESFLANVEWVGITKDKTIEKGWRVGGIYLVEYVEQDRLYSIVHLKEIDNNGRL